MLEIGLKLRSWNIIFVLTGNIKEVTITFCKQNVEFEVATEVEIF